MPTRGNTPLHKHHDLSDNKTKVACHVQSCCTISLSKNVFHTKISFFEIIKATRFPEPVTKIILLLDIIHDENLLCYLANYTYTHADKLNV